MYFWKDQWFKQGLYLRDTTDYPLSELELEETVSDFLLPNGSWNREKLRKYFPKDVCRDLLVCHIGSSDEVDSVVWNYPKEVEFSVKSAYSNLTKEGQTVVERHWSLIWRWPGNQHNRTFMWLYAKNKILTNVQRKKRDLTSNPLCSICRVEDESVIHVLRDCPASKDVWKMLVHPSHWSNFFKGDIIDWFLFNSKREIRKLHTINWKLTFGEAVRRLWLRRNSFIFKNKMCRTEDVFWSIILATKEYEDSMSVLEFSNSFYREVNVCWLPPAEGWIKCNVDGACRDDGIAAGCGGVFRDSLGRWISGFSMNLRVMDALSSEVWGILTGLKIAWEKEFRCVSGI